MMKEIIIINRVKCNKCGSIITSRSVHDYKTCSCGNVSVDGGLDYLRRNYESNDYTELNEGISINNDYSLVRNRYKQNDFKEQCCDCGSSNVFMYKGDGEFIDGNDLLGYSCGDCKKVFVFNDINFK